MNLSERIKPNSEAAPWVIEEVKKLEANLEAMTNIAIAVPSIYSAHERMERAEARLAAESAMLDWLESPYGRGFQRKNQDALICRETIRVAMKESTQ